MVNACGTAHDVGKTEQDEPSITINTVSIEREGVRVHVAVLRGFQRSVSIMGGSSEVERQGRNDAKGGGCAHGGMNAESGGSDRRPLGDATVAAVASSSGERVLGT